MIALFVYYLIVSLLIADFFTGLIHWAEDTYCIRGLSGLLGSQICEPNLLHHEDQTHFVRGKGFWSINYVVFIGSIIPFILFVYWGLYVLAAANFISAFGNQIHAWAHRKPRWVTPLLLQEMAILQTPHQHARHHKKPHNKCYCTVTNWLNPPLDRLYFWRGLEKLIYWISFKKVRPRPLIQEKNDESITREL